MSPRFPPPRGAANPSQKGKWFKLWAQAWASCSGDSPLPPEDIPAAMAALPPESPMLQPDPPFGSGVVRSFTHERWLNDDPWMPPPTSACVRPPRTTLCRSRHGKSAGVLPLPFARLPDLFLVSLSVPSASIKENSLVCACIPVLVPLTFTLERGFLKHPPVREPLNSLVSILLRVSVVDKVQNSPGDGARRSRVHRRQNPLLFLQKPAFDNSFVSCVFCETRRRTARAPWI